MVSMRLIAYSWFLAILNHRGSELRMTHHISNILTISNNVNASLIRCLYEYLFLAHAVSADVHAVSVGVSV